MKLAVDLMVEPSVDPIAIRSSVDQMVKDIMALVDADNSAMKLAALRRYLYESGAWNGNQPFRYDVYDPLGDKPENRLLQHYLTTRRGNCITMPILFTILGQRLGLKMTLSEAPLHVLVKYTDDDGKVWNLETTSGGGYTRDSWYRQKLPMSDKAIALGTYLRPLSQEETTSLVASLLIEDSIRRGAFEDAITVSDVLLRHYPDFAYGLVKKGSAYSALLRHTLSARYEKAADIPANIKAKADQWYAENVAAFARAEALGWRSQDVPSE
ncbi:transglutaminase family protein [Agrobacterium radiobacter]|uniref:Transglutaminase family protein n=1 Tax=Agrobacterium radiobacter TaxID=362 RepID=A0ABD5LSP5_AGRRD